MTTKLFGTDGIRARAGEYPLNSPSITAIGRAIGEKLGGRILVGQDTRISSPWIFSRLLEGILQTSATVESAGILPTPAVALLVQAGGYSGGIMISASHNPYADNGIKVFSSNGTKLNDADELRIEQRVAELVSAADRSHTDDIPDAELPVTISGEWSKRYLELLLSHFPSGKWLQGIHIVADCANGAMSWVAPEVLTRLGASVKVIHGSPNGVNINAGCGAVHLESLVESIQQEGSAHFGVAFDGDGDRSLFVRSNGEIVNGDAVLLVMARHLKAAGKLTPPSVIGTLMTNFTLERMLREDGIRLSRVAVGDRYIFEEMRRTGAPIGGEPSGHIIFSDFRLSGDGLLTTLKVLQTMVERGVTFDALTEGWVESPQLLKNLRVRRKVDLETVPDVQLQLNEARRELEGYGRLVVRYSGTEPLLRVMIESDDAARNERVMAKLLDTIQRHLEVIS